MSAPVFVKTYCVARKDGKVLLTQDLEGQPGWKFPGGHVEENELIKSAATREIFEETGYKIKITNVLLIEDFFNQKRKNEHNLRIYFVCDIVGGSASPKIDEVKTMRYFSLKELTLLHENEVYPPHRAALKSYLKNSFYSEDVICEVDK